MKRTKRREKERKESKKEKYKRKEKERKKGRSFLPIRTGRKEWRRTGRKGREDKEEKREERKKKRRKGRNKGKSDKRKEEMKIKIKNLALQGEVGNCGPEAWVRMLSTTKQHLQTSFTLWDIADLCFEKKCCLRYYRNQSTLGASWQPITEFKCWEIFSLFDHPQKVNPVNTVPTKNSQRTRLYYKRD